MNISNWTANDTFSQIGQLAIIPGPIGGLGHKTALALAADGALQ
jgi:hypothetical protein